MYFVYIYIYTSWLHPLAVSNQSKVLKIILNLEPGLRCLRHRIVYWSHISKSCNMKKNKSRTERTSKRVPCLRRRIAGVLHTQSNILLFQCKGARYTLDERKTRKTAACVAAQACCLYLSSTFHHEGEIYSSELDCLLIFNFFLNLSS